MLGIFKSLLLVALAATQACAAPTPAPASTHAHALRAPLAAASGSSSSGSSSSGSSSNTRTPKRSTFIVRRYENPRHVREGAIAMRHAYEKYGWAVPEALAPADDTGGSAPAAADSVADSRVRVAAASSAPHILPAETQFLAPVTIGGQAFTMNLDTGSADLWVFSNKLPPSSTTGQALFDPARSPTFRPLPGASFEIVYGDKSHAAGVVGTDTVNIGGVEVPEQAVELATRVSGSFVRDFNNDGLIGLGFSLLNRVQPVKQKTFFDNVMPTLEQPVFTAVLKRGVNGSYEFGYVDAAKFTGPLHNVSIDASRGWWEFNSPGITVGGKRISAAGAGVPSIADTGTSILLLHDAFVRAYYEHVPGARLDPAQGGWVFPCDAALPDLGIVISEAYTATIAGKLMTFSRVGRGNSCFGALQTNDGHPVQIFGDTLFNSQFVVFDGGNKQLGFAPHS